MVTGMEPYLTIKADARDEFEVKRSRFIGYARPVQTPEDAAAFVAEIRARHWDARHNCSAYVLRSGQQHSSDDGEPQGTAGQPIRTVILGRDLKDCCVVVTRYFGGTLLGTGGLVRAYTQAATLALDAAELIRMEPSTLCRITCDYTLYGRLPALIAASDGSVEHTDFADRVTVEFLMPTPLLPAFEQRLSDASSGQCGLERLGERYVEKHI